MTTSHPTEPARGPTLNVAAEDGLPPFDKRAAVAFACAIFPYLLYITALAGYVIKTEPTFGPLYWIWSLVSSVGGLAGPIIGFALGGATVRHLKAIPEEERPRGLGMARAARIIGLVTISLWFLAIFAVCAAFTLSGAGGD